MPDNPRTSKGKRTMTAKGRRRPSAVTITGGQRHVRIFYSATLFAFTAKVWESSALQRKSITSNRTRATRNYSGINRIGRRCANPAILAKQLPKIQDLPRLPWPPPRGGRGSNPYSPARKRPPGWSDFFMHEMENRKYKKDHYISMAYKPSSKGKASDFPFSSQLITL